MKIAHLPLDTLNAVIAILADRPFKEVVVIMQKLHQEVTMTDDAVPAPKVDADDP